MGISTIRTRDNKRVLSGSLGPSVRQAGYTNAEARGVFGSCHKRTEDERFRIAAYQAHLDGKDSPDELLMIAKQIYADVPRRMQRRQKEAKARMLALRREE